MPKFIAIQARPGAPPEAHTSPEALARFCARLSPCAGAPRRAEARSGPGWAAALTEARGARWLPEAGLLIGHLYEGSPGRPGDPLPDGSYVLVRRDEGTVEIAADPLGSTSIWYALDKERLVVASSQRAVAMALGDFEPRPEALAWFLSTGSLGPLPAWDERVEMIPPGSSVTLDRKAWTLTTRRERPHPRQIESSEEEHVERFQGALRAALRSLRALPPAERVVSLSGGVDSRLLLALMHQDDELRAAGLRTISWGSGARRDLPGGDARASRELAAYYGAQHHFYENDEADDLPVHEIVERFLSQSEGRVDHIGGYLDGMRMWERMREDGIVRLVRGDHAIGKAPAFHELDARSYTAALVCSDFANLRGACHELGLPEQELPIALRRAEWESLAAWRDRLYRDYLRPYVLAGLGDAQYGFLDQINPLGARGVLRAICELPDELRTSKLIARLATPPAPGAPAYSSHGNNVALAAALRAPRVTDWLRASLADSSAGALFPASMLARAAAGLARGARPAARFARFARLIPRRAKRALRSSVVPLSLDGHLFALRLALAAQAHAMIREDARFGRVTD